MANIDKREDAGEFYPGGKVVPRTPVVRGGDVRHSDFADMDPDTTPLAAVIERLKGSAMTIALALTSLIASYAASALPVTPAYTNNNRYAGMVMTNIVQWASAVETAIGQGGGGGVTTQQATNIAQKVIREDVRTNYLCTVEAAQAKADEVKDYADGKFVKFVSNGYHNQISDEYEVSVPWSFTGGLYSFLSFDGDETYGIQFVGTGATIKNSTGNFVDFYSSDSSNSRLTIDNSPVVTSNMMNAVVSSTSVTNLGAVAAATNMIATVERTVNDWETYWRGDRVRLLVTNYYGNTSGELPRLRIEEFDHSTTTVVDNVQIISNFFHTVWDENDRHTNYMATTDAKVNTISNNVLNAAWRQTNLQLVNKAPRAWQTVTSAGEDAPPNTVWHTAPQSVFAGGTEYAHVAVGEGTICVLVDKGAPVYTDGAEGQFRFQDQSGQNYFGFDVRSAYKIGCRTDGIAVNSQTHIVALTYDLTSSTNPSILQSTNLVDWADAEVEWEQNPPEGTKVCYINCGTSPRGFYQAEIRYAGGSKFLTNMQADLMGGIAASNQTLNVIQSVEPYVVSNQVMWRVKQ